MKAIGESAILLAQLASGIDQAANRKPSGVV
jgi:hypothetical protein